MNNYLIQLIKHMETLHWPLLIFIFMEKHHISLCLVLQNTELTICVWVQIKAISLQYFPAV